MTAFTAFSQNNYPRPVVIDGDTVEAITRPQMRSLIALRYEYSECDSVRSLLSYEVTEQISIAAQQDSSFAAAQEEMQGYDAEVRLLNRQLVVKGSELTVNKNLMKLKQRNGIVGGVTGCLISGAIGLIVGLFIHK